MGIPLNLIQFYIGAPILAYICIRGLFFAKDKSNPVTRYVAYATGIFAVAALIYSIPVLFTHDSNILTIGTIIADTFQYLSLATVGFLACHLSLSQWPTLKKFVNLLVIILSGVYVYVSVRENLAFPAHVISTAEGIQLALVSTRTYNIWNGLAFTSLFFVGVSFLSQLRQVMRSSQRYRVAALGTFFVLNGLLFPAIPIFNLDVTSLPIAVSVAVSFILMAILMALSFMAARREPIN